MADESTTKIKVDLNELKKEFREANQQIQLVNSEFKASTASMNRWSDNADGVSAKLRQLNGVLDAEENKLESLRKQYDLVVASQGENSEGARRLMIQLNNQQASVDRVKNSIQYYSDQLNNLNTESEKATTASATLRSEIAKQESDLDSLKQSYSDLVIEQKEGTDEARQLASQIDSLSQELNENKSRLDSAENAANNLDKTLDDTSDSAVDSAEGFTVLKGALADLVADGIRAVGDGLKEMVFSADSAYSDFQAQTHASAEEMENFKSEMDELYKNAYGETLQDIGDKMAYVKNVTGEVDSSTIRELTESAMALEDTFGSDFNETIRGVNNLMQHFGIDAETAFDLFTAGSQAGLDYTGELGDNIAEYGGNFQQAGYSAEEYFQLLENGTDAGAYNLDKVNDSINEVKNRLGDGTIGKNIDIFSDGTKDVFEAWEDGEATMKDVIDSIVDDINGCESEQEALNMAATAFGTMGEDANLKVVKSLKSTGDTFKDTKGRADELKNVKYDNLETQLTTLGRTIITDVAQPLIKQALPYAKEFVSWLTNNLDSIVPVAGAVATAIGGIFVINKISTFAQSISSLIGIFTGLTGAVGGATTGVGLLNTAFLSNPVTLGVVAAVGALVAAYVGFKAEQDRVTEAYFTLSEAEQANASAVQASKEAYEQMMTARAEAVEGIEAESGKYSSLWTELQGLVDQNGKVKDGYEDRASAITSILSKALGIEIDLTDGVIENYQELKKSIDEVIASKKLEALTNAYESDYSEALKTETEAWTNLNDAQKIATATQSELADAQAELSALQEQEGSMLLANAGAQKAWQEQLNEAKGKVQGLENQLESNNETLADAEDAYAKNQATIQNYEGALAAAASGDLKAVQEANSNLTNSFVTATVGVKSALEEQVDHYSQHYKDLVAAQKAGAPGVTQEMVDEAKNMVTKSTKELEKYTRNASKEGEKALNEMAGSVRSNSGLMANASKDVARIGSDGFGTLSDNFFTEGKEATEAGAEGALSEAPVLGSTASGLNEQFIKNLDMSGPAWKTGSDGTSSFISGADSNKSKVVSTASGLSNEANKALGSADTASTGKNETSEYAKGLGSINTYNPAMGRSQSANSGFGAVNMSGQGSKATNQYNSGVGSVNTFSPASNRAGSANSGFGSINMAGQGSRATNQFNSGVGSVNTYGTASNRASSANSGFGSVGMLGAGKNATSQYVKGLGSIVTYPTGSNRAESARSGMQSVSTYSTGTNFTQGFINGIKSLNPSSAANWVGRLAINSLKAVIKEGSPSRITYESGEFFDLGFINAIADGTKKAAEVARNLGSEAISALNDEVSSPINAPIISTIPNAVTARSRLANAGFGGTSTTTSNVTNNYNFTQTNNSPKALSRLEIYRQTKNQINFARGVA